MGDTPDRVVISFPIVQDIIDSFCSSFQRGGGDGLFSGCGDNVHFLCSFRNPLRYLGFSAQIPILCVVAGFAVQLDIEPAHHLIRVRLYAGDGFARLGVRSVVAELANEFGVFVTVHNDGGAEIFEYKGIARCGVLVKVAEQVGQVVALASASLATFDLYAVTVALFPIGLVVRVGDFARYGVAVYHFGVLSVVLVIPFNWQRVECDFFHWCIFPFRSPWERTYNSIL